jgi:cell wall-associated NlpC family hydrolase
MRPTLQRLQPTHAMSRSHVRTAVRLLAIAFLCAMAAFATQAATPSASGAASLAEKRALAARLDKQVSKLELRYDSLQERYRGALIELDNVHKDVNKARVEVRQTRKDRGVAQTRLRGRAVAIYLAGGVSTSLSDVAASGSFTEFFDRIDAVRRVGDQDADVLDQIRTLNEHVEKKERALSASLKRQSVVVARAKRDKAKMQSLLAQRQAKLNSVNADIRAIMDAQRRAEEARRAAAARASAALVQTGGSSGGGSSDAGGGISIPLPPGSSSSAAAASAALTKLGSPYVWAAAGPSTFDCSGLVVWAFGQVGRSMPHSSYALAGMGVDVPLDQVQAGDLVFGYGDGHVGIAISGSSFVHAPHTGDVVKVSPISSSYGISHARRV